MKKYLFEACVDSLDSAITAEKNGADRIELCSALLEGGITPSYALIKLVRERLSIPVNVIIRPRGGDFFYSDSEFEVMKEDILFCKQTGINGVVLGLLDENGSVDKIRTKELIDVAHPMSVTFHRAFDMCRDPFEVIDTLIDLGAERVLTSGQEADVYKGIPMLIELVKKANDKIIIMPGGGVNENNIAEVVSKTGVKEIHASARERVKSRMKFRKPKTSMSDSGTIEEYEIMVTSAARIKAMVEILNSLSAEQ